MSETTRTRDDGFGRDPSFFIDPDDPEAVEEFIRGRLREAPERWRGVLDELEDWQVAGRFGVDAGLCWIGDPCHLAGGEGGGGAELLADWQAFCGRLHALDHNARGTTAWPMPDGREGRGVVVSTGIGDGVYAVEVRRVDDEVWGPRIAEVRVRFIAGGLPTGVLFGGDDGEREGEAQEVLDETEAKRQGPRWEHQEDGDHGPVSIYVGAREDGREDALASVEGTASGYTRDEEGRPAGPGSPDVWTAYLDFGGIKGSKRFGRREDAVEWVEATYALFGRYSGDASDPGSEEAGALFRRLEAASEKGRPVND